MKPKSYLRTYIIVKFSNLSVQPVPVCSGYVVAGWASIVLDNSMTHSFSFIVIEYERRLGRGCAGRVVGPFASFVFVEMNIL